MIKAHNFGRSFGYYYRVGINIYSGTSWQARVLESYWAYQHDRSVFVFLSQPARVGRNWARNASDLGSENTSFDMLFGRLIAMKADQ